MGAGSYWFLGLSGRRARRIKRSRPLHADRSRRGCIAGRMQRGCDPAVKWIHAGQHQGRDQLDIRSEFASLAKDSLLRPIGPSWRSILDRYPSRPLPSK